MLLFYHKLFTRLYIVIYPSVSTQSFLRAFHLSLLANQDCQPDVENNEIHYVARISCCCSISIRYRITRLPATKTRRAQANARTRCKLSPRELSPTVAIKQTVRRCRPRLERCLANRFLRTARANLTSRAYDLGPIPARYSPYV